jgi:hypothetical protein
VERRKLCTGITPNRTEHLPYRPPKHGEPITSPRPPALPGLRLLATCTHLPCPNPAACSIRDGIPYLAPGSGEAGVFGGGEEGCECEDERYGGEWVW